MGIGGFMLGLFGPGIRFRDRVSRREVLRIGGLGLAGSSVIAPTSLGSTPRTKSVIILFLMGGPPQHSTWDPKPDAPEQVRGAFGPIATTVPGMSVSSLMPRMAMVADKLCLLRAVSTGDNANSSSGYYMLTGRPHQPMNFENANPGAPNDMPSLGGIIARYSSSSTGLPSSITLPHRIFNTDGSVWPGQDAGLLGRLNDPWLLNATTSPEGYRVQEITLPSELGPDRLGRRRTCSTTFSVILTASKTTASPA